MPKLLRPSSPRLIRSHPLAVGLSDAVLLQGDSGWNYANEAVQPAFAGSVTSEPTADSPGSRTSSGTNYITLTPAYNIAAAQFTVSMLWKPVTNAGAFVAFLEKSNGGSRELAFFGRYTAPNLGNISYYTIGTSLSGDVNYATGMVDGGTYRFTVTRNAANLISFYVNGRLINSATFTGSTAVSGSAWNLGRNASGGGQHPNAVYGDMFVWPTRALSAEEVAEHAAEPWAMLRPTRTMLSAPGASNEGTGAVTLGAVTAAGVGSLSITGTGAATLDAVTASGVGSLALTGTAATTLASMTAAGVGSLAITGTGAATLAALSATGVGSLAITGTGAATLDDLTASGTSATSNEGAAAVTLADLSAAGVGSLALTATGAATLGDVSAAAVGTLSIVGTGAATLAALTGQGVGSLSIVGVGAATLADLTAAGSDAPLAEAIPAPASRTYTWATHSRDTAWPAHSRAVAWPAHSRNVEWQE